MKMFTKLLESKRNIAGLLLLAGLVFTTYSIQENSMRIKRLTNFESGMQTCFARVNQTYTAKILEDTASNYLSSNFQNLTEECFAEGILNVEDSFKTELSIAAKKLSTLASNVHWFHEDILAPAGVRNIAGTNEPKDISSRFEKIEMTKDEILESSEQLKNVISDSLNKEKSFFYVSAILLVLVMLSEFMSTTRRRLSNQARELEAKAELLDNGGAVSVKVGEIIRTALEQNDLINCSKLFTNFHAQSSFDKNIKNKTKFSLENLITPIGSQSAAAVNEKIDKIWNNDTIGVMVDNDESNDLRKNPIEQENIELINLEKMNSRVVDLLAEKFFSRGIKLDVKIAENISVKARSEELEQILYHLMNYAINSTHSESGEKNISIFAHKMGDIITYDLIHSGMGFEEEILMKRVGLGNSNKSLDVDLLICNSLLEEIQAKTQLDNKLNQNGDIIGGRIKIIFKGGISIENSRLVDLKVGSKKEILASFNSSSVI